MPDQGLPPYDTSLLLLAYCPDRLQLQHSRSYSLPSLRDTLLTRPLRAAMVHTLARGHNPAAASVMPQSGMYMCATPCPANHTSWSQALLKLLCQIVGNTGSQSDCDHDHTP